MAGSAKADDELLGLSLVQKGKTRHVRPKQCNYGRRNHSRRAWRLGTSAKGSTINAIEITCTR
jgi:hypothetical protein